MADNVMYCISGKLTWIPLYAALLWFVCKQEGWKNLLGFIVIVALMVFVADQGAGLAKTYLPKFRPTHNADLQGLIHTVNDYRGGLYGTVSSHASNSFALAIFCSLIFKRGWVWISLLVWASVVAYSRIYLGVHFPYDVVLGALLGVAVGFAAYYGYNKTKILIARKTDKNGKTNTNI